jgi:hypothetical protein
VKLVIWAVCGVLALFWTLAAWAAASLFGWAAGLATPGDAVELGRMVTSWPIPAWLTLWIDPAAIHAALGGVVWSLEQLQQGWPWISSMIGWLVPATWIVWGIGMATLLLVTVLVQVLVQRLRSPALRPA